MSTPELVTIQGYNGPAEDAALSPDGSLLFFDSHVDQPSMPIAQLWASKIDYKTWQFRGQVNGINQPPAITLGGTLDRNGNFYFVTTVSGLPAVMRGSFDGAGNVTNAAVVPGFGPLPSRPGRQGVIMDARSSTSGEMLCLGDEQFPLDANGNPYPPPQSGQIGLASRNADGSFTRIDTSAILANVNALNKILYGAHISDDGLGLVFTGSDLLGEGDQIRIYRSIRASGSQPFGMPQELVTPFHQVESPYPAPDGHIYFHQVISPGSAQIYVMMSD